MLLYTNILKIDIEIVFVLSTSEGKSRVSNSEKCLPGYKTQTKTTQRYTYTY